MNGVDFIFLGLTNRWVPSIICLANNLMTSILQKIICIKNSGRKLIKLICKQLSGIHKTVISFTCNNFQCFSIHIWMLSELSAP